MEAVTVLLADTIALAAAIADLCYDYTEAEV